MTRGPTMKASDCLRRNQEKILALWSERARNEIPAAADKPELMLRDALPNFLRNLVRALSPNEPDDVRAEKEIAKEHAEQRDQQGDYSLSQVIAEYFILQKTLFEVLEVEMGWPMTSGDRDAVQESIALAVREAGSRFAKLQIKRLEKSNQALEHFAHIASHDLHEPLRTVRTYLSLIRKKLRESPDAELAEYFDFVVDASARMKAQIDSLMAYSQIGRSGELLVSTDFNEVFERAVSNLQVAIKDSGATVTSDPLPKLSALPIEMERLFQNLIGNALKFAAKEPPRVHVSAELEPRRWVFSVADNGIGIQPGKEDSIFELFSRLNHAQVPGSGIGLSVCRRVVELHGGTIWAKAHPGGGTIFQFSIPTGR